MTRSIGFTGTRNPSPFSIQRLARVLEDLYRPDSEFHHGDCLGADRAAAEIAHNVGYKIIVHPPSDSKARAFTVWGTILPEKPYMERNSDIVNASDILVAAPKGAEEELRSGTWATIRRARKRNMVVILVTNEGVIYE